jgi:hypothetical protein
MRSRTPLRRLTATAMLACALGAPALPQPASASGINAVRSDAPALAGYCWNKPILPDWCVPGAAGQWW